MRTRKALCTGCNHRPAQCLGPGSTTNNSDYACWKADVDGTAPFGTRQPDTYYVLRVDQSSGRIVPVAVPPPTKLDVRLGEQLELFGGAR